MIVWNLFEYESLSAIQVVSEDLQVRHFENLSVIFKNLH